MRTRPSKPPPGTTPAQARAALAEASGRLAGLTSQLAVINAALKTLLIDHASDAPPVVAKVAERVDVKRNLIAARDAVSNAREGLQQTLAIWFGSGTSADEIKLLSAQWPVVLFPVRIETRFAVQTLSPTLLVRIYPDDISIDTHEPLLTDAETAAADDYWKIAATSGQEEAWYKLLVTYRPTRAAWIVHATARPDNDDGDFHLFLPPRSAAWTRPAYAVGMPERFHVVGYRGGTRVITAVGAPVVEPLAVSLDPSVDPDDADAVVDVSGHGLDIDRELAWTVEFEAAVTAGMALRIPLSPEDAVHGFDQLFVVGVKASTTPNEAGAQLASLLDAQHYTAGWSFIRQGTPTHKTSDASSPYPPADLGGAHSFRIERGSSLGRPGGNGAVFATALGIDATFTDHIENADLLEQPHAQAFNDAIWPGTLGYYMRQMFDPGVAAVVAVPGVSAVAAPSLQTARFDSHLATVDSEARAHFVAFVRGIAALPPIRVGRKVYGVLPVTSLARWQPDSEAIGLDLTLPPLLATLLKIWSSTLDAVPRVGRTNDTDADLLTTLGMEARSRSVRIAQMLGPTAQFNLLSLSGIAPEDWEKERRNLSADVMAAIGHPSWDPLIGWMSFSRTADLFVRALVSDVTSEDSALDPNYISWIRNSSVDSLRREIFAQRRPPPVPTALLYHLLRYAALTEYDRLGTLLSASGGELGILHMRPDEELVGFDVPLPNARGTTHRLTAWERLNQRIPVTGAQTIAEYLLDPARDADGGGAHAYRQSLAAIEGLPTAELERLFTATLDTCSDRLESWITSFSTKRLASMRARNPRGAHWGAYGWIENLRPLAKPKTETLADGRIAIVQTSSDGYIQAPTMTHATAGAVLRNAYRTRSGGDSERYGIDLSSGRVRKALRILEKVRSGESLGSALGHQFESGLRDRSTPHAAVDSIRNLFPLVANKLADSHQPADRVAARNVVDGLRLIDAFRDGSIAFDATVLPTGSSVRSAVESELKELEDTIDSISDLFTAESVFQSMRGNTTAAAASLDAIAGGMRPPELECVQQPRGGTALTHRFAVVLGGVPVATPLWTAPPSPRSIAEPLLDGWIGSLLGDPATIRCRTRVVNPSLGIEGDGPDVSLAELQLRPIDFLSLAVDAAENVEGISELDIHITRFVGMPSVGIDNTPWPDRTIRTFVDAIETARAIRALIAASRPLRAEDLVAPENAKNPAPTVTPSTRAADAKQKLLALQNELSAKSAPGFDAGQLDTALVKASQFGIKGALSTGPILFPAVRDDLARRAANVLREIDSRLAEAGQPADHKTEDEIARAVFGADFVLLPSFTPTRPAELAQALAYAPSLVGNDPLAVPNWIRKAAPVRDPVALFRAMSVRVNALGVAGAPFAVVQLPFAPNASWVALPFADEAHRPPSGRASIVLQRASTPAATDAWAGLVFDEWSELIPSASEQTAVSLQYEHPRAEAPQAVLIAVPPSTAQTWDFESLLDCVRETLHLAKVRGADLETLGTIGQIVPALCLASNANGDAVSALLSSMLEQPPSLQG